MAQIVYLGGQTGRALDLIRKAVELNPFEAEYHFVLARCLEETNASAAIDAIARAVLLNDKIADFHNTLGNLLDKTRDYAGAVRSYRTAVALEPENAIFHPNLSLALEKTGAKSESEKEKQIYMRLSAKGR